MRTPTPRLRTLGWLSAAALAAPLALAAGCGNPLTPLRAGAPHIPFDLAPFQQMARASSCADQLNRLLVIDTSLVLWDRAGSCPDNSYAQTLYGTSVTHMLCRNADSIAGPVKTCLDQRYLPMFDTIISHLDLPDLGLGPGHTVQVVPL